MGSPDSNKLIDWLIDFLGISNCLAVAHDDDDDNDDKNHGKI